MLRLLYAQSARPDVAGSALTRKLPQLSGNVSGSKFRGASLEHSAIRQILLRC
jgi:hypothetical protein